MFWGPLPPPNTQLAVVQSLSDMKATFRFLAKGIVFDVNQATKPHIVKKSKRIGNSCKIFGETAFVKDMFKKSDIEIDDFKDAKIQTDSGIDGKIVQTAVGGDVFGERVAKCIFNRKIREQDTIVMDVYEQVAIPWVFNPRTIGPDPPDRIWVDGVSTCYAGSYIPVMPKVCGYKLKSKDVELFRKKYCIECLHKFAASKSEKDKWKQKLMEVEFEIEESEKKVEEEDKPPSPFLRRATVEQLRVVRFNSPGPEALVWL